MSLFKNECHERIYNALIASGKVAGEGWVLELAEIAADAAAEAHEGYPRSAGSPASDDMVSILVTETTARGIETNFLKPRGLSFSPAIVFSEDDTPTYILQL